MDNQVISFHYTLKDEKGGVIDSSRNSHPMSFLVGRSQIIPGLEKILVTLQKGDKREVAIAAADAYGAYDKALVREFPRNKFPKKEIQVGQVFQIGQGENHRVATVTAVSDAHVTLDANHPLAGKDLNFEVEMMEMREATVEEVVHGHAHGEGGHGHGH